MTTRNEVVGALLCMVVAVGSGSVFAQSPFAQSPKKSVDIIDAPGVHGFSVTLVLGDMQGASNPDNLPLGARKALADMRDFLPYKSYRSLDTQWILCCGSSKVGTGVSGRLRGIGQGSSLRGLDEQEYSFTVTVLGGTGQQLSVRFLLTDAGNSALKKRLTQNPESPAEKELQRQMEEILRNSGGAKGAVIDSTFSMDIGETVVIGTSSLKGDKALVAVLTAVRRPGTHTSTIGEKR